MKEIIELLLQDYRKVLQEASLYVDYGHCLRKLIYPNHMQAGMCRYADVVHSVDLYEEFSKPLIKRQAGVSTYNIDGTYWFKTPFESHNMEQLIESLTSRITALENLLAHYE